MSVVYVRNKDTGKFEPVPTIQGAPGVTPQFEFDVEMGLPGSKPKIEQTGTAANPHVKLTIPQASGGDGTGGGGVPFGGSAGQTLVKQSDDDGDAQWDNPSLLDSTYEDPEDVTVNEDGVILPLKADDSDKLGGEPASAYVLKSELGDLGGEPASDVSWEDVQNKPETFPPESHEHNQYTTTQQVEQAVANALKDFTPDNPGNNEPVSIAWEDVENKPETFPPEQHEHDYAATEHTHEYAPVNHEHNYAAKDHTHNYAPADHGHNYAPAEHTHDYAATNHTHKPEAIGAAPSSHTHNYVPASQVNQAVNTGSSPTFAGLTVSGTLTASKIVGAVYA